MKRLSVSLPPEIEKTIIDLRKTDEFCMCSCGESEMKFTIQITGGSIDAQRKCRDELYKCLLHMRRDKNVTEDICFEIKADCRGIVSAACKGSE